MDYILVTGSNGMIGTHLVNELINKGKNVIGISNQENNNISVERYIHIKLDLTNCIAIEEVFNKFTISHVIHLAGIAHISKGMDDSWDQYYRINTLVSKTLFKCAANRKIPVFFASSIDVYGITDNQVNEEIIPKSVGKYAKSKYMAEQELKKICKDTAYMIARFAPVYTEDNKKDIRKRYYLKYPKVCFRLGQGEEYEFLSIEAAINIITKWVDKAAEIKQALNVRDLDRINTKELIKQEQAIGNGKIVIWMPEWSMKCLKGVIQIVFKDGSFLKFTLFKILAPVRTDDTRLKSFLGYEK